MGVEAVNRLPRCYGSSNTKSSSGSSTPRALTGSSHSYYSDHRTEDFVAKPMAFQLGLFRTSESLPISSEPHRNVLSDHRNFLRCSMLVPVRFPGGLGRLEQRLRGPGRFPLP